ncbi:MAG TPA: S8 family serine peptidase [Micromonosporaceae bacterium]
MAPDPVRRNLPATARAGILVLITGLGVSVPATVHADEVRDRQWHLDFLGIAEAHEISRGEGVTVAVLDSGVDHRHPDLKGALLEGRNFSGGRRDGWEDADGHGTAMASLVAARGHGQGHRAGVLGVAPATKILPVRTDSGGVTNSRGLEQGVRWAADHGADVLSISQGWFDDPAIQESIDYALGEGAIIVAGAGNTAKGDDEVMAPARYPGVIAVSGTDPDGNFSTASVSGVQVVLSAPGTSVHAAAANLGYGSGTGTSPATAIVAGVAALVKARYPDLDAANVINRLISTAEDRGPKGRDPRYGYGIVDPVAALTRDIPRVRGNPLVAPSAPTAVRTAPGQPGTVASGIGPGGWGLITVGTLGVLTLTVTALTGLVRRRRPRTTRCHGMPDTRGKATHAPPGASPPRESPPG